MDSVPERPSSAVERVLAEHDWSGCDAALVRLLDGVWRRRQQATQTAHSKPAAEPSTESSPPAQTKRPRRLKPSKLAKWEAAWQAEQDAEAES